MMATAEVSGAHAENAITTEIIRNAFIAATEEMKSNLMRTAYNMIIYEALDFTVGLFDRHGDTISIGIGLPMFIRGMSEAVKAKIRHFGLGNMAPGDIYLTNDAYITGSHLNHLTFSMPVFHDNEVVGFSSCMAHWQDVGGTLDGMTTDIFSEGLQIPIIKAWRAGVPNQDLLDIIRMNVRLPERAMGDLAAQVATVVTGERRFSELHSLYGRSTVDYAITMIYAQSEASARERLRSIRPGIYTAESYMDDDGIDIGKRVPLRVTVKVDADEMTIDLSEISGQVRGFFNSGETAGLSSAQVAFKCLTSPTDLPINAGSFRPLKVILPPGTVVSAQKPAPMRWWMTYPMTVIDTVFKALSQAVPERVIAGHHADLCVASVHGRQPADNKLFLYVGGLTGGGWGAKHNEDGVSATIAINDGDTHNSPIEHVEAKYPLLIERYALRPDSGGAGKFRGGLGTEQIVVAQAEFMLSTQIERVHCLPWGLFGGLAAQGNEVLTRGVDGQISEHPSGKVLSRLLGKSEAYYLRSGGGGGFGSPLDRDVERVVADVREGYISRKSAHDAYGVLFDPETMDCDRARTAELREAMRRAGLPRSKAATADDTTTPAMATEQPDEPQLAITEWTIAIREAGLMRARCGCC